MPDTPSPVSRRSILLGGSAAVGLGAAGLVAAPAWATTTTGGGHHPLPSNPFTLGVASGDPLSDSVVLWTRLALDPLAETGLGAMPDRRYEVRWQIAKDERFRHIVRSGSTTADPSAAHSVHVEPEGLRDGTEYYYRFRVGDHYSPVGRTTTTPRRGMRDLTMCFASCSHFGEGYFTAYRRLAEDHPDLILHLGDYQYEYATKAADVRVVAGPETRTLAGYRQRHAQYKTDPDLQLAHATAPWLVIWDDHETENNWADEVPEAPDPGVPRPARRRVPGVLREHAAAPHRPPARHRHAAVPALRVGRAGDVPHARHPPVPRRPSLWRRHEDRLRGAARPGADDHRCRAGAWLMDGLRRSRARWDVLGQQVFFAQRDSTAGPQQGFSMDGWDGYRASRDRVAAALGQTRNGVVLTGDVHRHWAGEIKADHDRPDSRGVGVELVATSVTSSGDGGEDTNAGVLAENPHLKFYKNRRGYVRTRFTAGQLRSDFRILPYVRTPDGPATTAASFVTEDRDPSLHPA